MSDRALDITRSALRAAQAFIADGGLAETEPGASIYQQITLALAVEDDGIFPSWRKMAMEALTTGDLRPWGWAPGHYMFRCDCAPADAKPIEWPDGAKYSTRCRSCAEKARDEFAASVATPASEPAP